MALYAFDGTWNEDDPTEGVINEDTNVVRFKDAYDGKFEYIPGVGTRFGAIGRFFGGTFGAGGQERIDEMKKALQKYWKTGDKDIDIIGFSRGAALAVHFANVIEKDGIEIDGETIKPEIRFLGVWDIVGSFGIPRDIIFNFQSINMGYDLTLPDKVQHCFHAMALHERRDCFKVTRLDELNQINRANETWFRGVHSDVGGGNKNIGLSNISLAWMLKNAAESGVPIKDAHIAKAENGIDTLAPISHNADVIIGPRRRVRQDDAIHSTAIGKKLEVGQSMTFSVDSKQLYNWSGIQLERGAYYSFKPNMAQKWKDASIECDANGWETEDLPWLKENVVKLFEDNRRCPDADWFEMIGSIDDDGDQLFRIGAGGQNRTYQAVESGEFFAFANDLVNKYDNNQGTIDLCITRVDAPGTGDPIKSCC